jgi:glycosyltransferase involved in cell wall biosynthesis
MRVCLVSQEYPPETAHGGIGTQTWNKAHQLVALGHEVHVLSCGKEGGGSDTHDRDGNLVVHRMAPPAERAGERFPIFEQAAYLIGYTWRVAAELERLLRETPFDLIGFPEYGAEGFCWQLNRTRYNWRPVVVQLHGPLAMFADRVGWPDKGSRFYRVADFMEGESIRMADGLMASSANIADYVVSHYGVNRESIHVVHCGVDCKVFRPLEDGQPRHSRPTVLFVGNAARSKGIWVVFEAVLRLRHRYPDIRLQIVGRGRELDSLRSAADRAGAAGNLEILGFLADREQLPELYRRAHVFSSPAFHEVGVANVYVEAMACGCPVVACDTGGAPEAVDDGDSGLLVPPRDVDATAAALDRILGDPGLRDRMGRAGRRRAEEYFATDQYIARVLSAYDDTLRRADETLASLSQPSRGPS